jgi:DNA-binding transcriptional LysR family regulator
VSRERLAGKRSRIDGSSRGLELLVFTPAHHRLQGVPWFQPVLASSTIVMSTNSTHALLAAARLGAGIAVLPRFAAALYDDLVAVSEDVSPRDDMWLVIHPEFRRDPKVRATAEFLKRSAATLR